MLIVIILSVQPVLSFAANDFGLATSALRAQLINNTTANETGAGPLKDIVQKVIGYILSFVGIIFLVQTIIAGLIWMTASGNLETTKKAKDQLKNSIIGLIIIAGAYLISSFVFQFINTITS